MVIDQARFEKLRADAWRDYLDTVKEARAESEADYRAIEPLAWELLQANLGKLEQLEQALEESNGGQAGHVPAR